MKKLKELESILHAFAIQLQKMELAFNKMVLTTEGLRKYIKENIEKGE